MAAVIKIEIVSSSADRGLKDTAKGLDDIDKAAKNTKGGFDTLKGVGTAALGAVAVAAGAAAVAIGGFVKDSIGAAGTFEAAINGFAAVTGTSLADAGFDMDAVSAKALQLGKDTQYSAQEAIQAMTELAKGGVPVESVMTDATDATLALAAAGGVDLPNAAAIVAKSLGVWAREGVTAAQVSDLLASAANASTVDVQELADGMANAAGRAQAMNLDYKDFVTTMALIAPGFSSAQEAGTSYNNFLSRLQPTTKGATKAMVELGLITEDGTNTFFDSTGAFIGNREAAEKLRQALSELSPQQRGQYLQTIFGNDAMGAANMLLQEGAEGYDRMAASMASMGGAQDVAAAKQQGFAFAMEQLSGSFETLQIVIGTKLLPMITPLVEQFTTGLNAVLSFVDTFSNLAPAIAESEDPIRTFFNILRVSTDDSLNPMINKVQEIVGAIQSFGATLQANATPIIAGFAGVILAVAVPAFTAWATAATASAAATIAALAPVLIPIAAIGAAAAVLGLAWQQNWGDIQGKTAAAWAVIQPVLTELWTWLSTNIPPAVQKVADFFNTTILPAVTAFAGFVTGTLLPALTNIVLYGFDTVYTAVSKLAGEVSTALQPAIEAASTFLGETFKGVLEILQPILANTSGAVSAVGGAFDAVASAVGGAVSAVKEFLEYAAKVKPPNLGGGGGSDNSGTTAGAKALGGSVMAGEAYMVGERGPELFVPQNSGAIVDANRTAAMRSTTNNYNYSPTYSSTPSNPSADFAMLKSLATAGT